MMLFDTNLENLRTCFTEFLKVLCLCDTFRFSKFVNLKIPEKIFLDQIIFEILELKYMELQDSKERNTCRYILCNSCQE